MAKDERRSANEQQAGADEQVLSPELALVDRAAGERARQALQGIVLTEDSVQSSRGDETQSVEQPVDEGVEEILRLVDRANVRGAARRRRRFRRRMLLLVTLILALGAGAAVWLSLEGGDTKTASSPGVSTAGAANLTSHSQGGATRSIPDFVWSAAKGAAAYRVEFLRGARVVQTATTSGPRLHITAASLPPGNYRWTVWAIDRSGARIGTAIVNAFVHIR